MLALVVDDVSLDLGHHLMAERLGEICDRRELPSRNGGTHEPAMKVLVSTPQREAASVTAFRLGGSTHDARARCGLEARILLWSLAWQLQV